MTARVIKTTSPSEGLPAGFITGAQARKLLGLDYDQFEAKWQLGELPAPETVSVMFADGPRKRQLWRESAILKSIPRPKGGVRYKYPPATMAMLSILKKKTRNGLVSGDETDFICGNPPTESIWQDILPLVEDGVIETGKDNWDRITFTFKKENDNGKNDGYGNDNQGSSSIPEGKLFVH